MTQTEDAKPGQSVQLHYTDYDTRLSAYALIVDECERVLLVLWNGSTPPQWTLPGGGVELDETVEQAAVRELFEETGHNVALGDILGVDSRVHRHSVEGDLLPRPLKTVRVVFSARVIDGALRYEVGGSTDEARWIPLADVPNLARVPLVNAGIQMWRSAARQPHVDTP